MKKIISATTAGHLLLLLFALLFVFHLLVVFRVVPTDLIWGGRMESPEALLRLELWALALTVVWAIIIALKMGYLRWIKNRKAINIAVWVLFLFFVLNTLGNLLATSPIEKFGFGSMTFIAALLTLRLAVES